MNWWSQFGLKTIMLAAALTRKELSRPLCGTQRIAAIRGLISYLPFSNWNTLVQSMTKSQEEIVRMISVTSTTITTNREVRQLQHQRRKKAQTLHREDHYSNQRIRRAQNDLRAKNRWVEYYKWQQELDIDEQLRSRVEAQRLKLPKKRTLSLTQVASSRTQIKGKMKYDGSRQANHTVAHISLSFRHFRKFNSYAKIQYHFNS